MRCRSAVLALLVAFAGSAVTVIGSPAVAAGSMSTFAYVSDDDTTLSVIDVASLKVVATAVAGPEARGVAVTPDGAFVYVVNQATFSGNSVTVFNTVTNTAVTTVPVGVNPAQVAITPDGRFAYVTNVGGASTTASFTVTDPKTSHSRTVAVTASGQVSIQ